jgi:hypothetical protein
MTENDITQTNWFQLYRISSTKGHKADKLVSIEQF